MADDHRMAKIAILKNDLILVAHEAEKLGLELIASFLRMAILESGHLLKAERPR